MKLTFTFSEDRDNMDTHSTMTAPAAVSSQLATSPPSTDLNRQADLNFAVSIASAYQCAVCQSMATPPTARLSNCGHRLCSTCIPHVPPGTGCCPGCNQVNSGYEPDERADKFIHLAWFI